MTELTEASLEEVIEKIMKMTEDKGKLLALKSTKFFVPRYAGETDEEYKARVEVVKKYVESFK